MKTISSLNAMDSAKLSSLLRQVGKKFYLKKTSCLHMTSEEFMSDTWSDRICTKYHGIFTVLIKYHGLVIVLEGWTWNSQDKYAFTIYYKGMEINPFQWKERIEVIEYAKTILWYLSGSSFRDIFHYPLFKEEIAEILGLKDEIKKFEKKSKKVREELMETLTKSR